MKRFLKKQTALFFIIFSLLCSFLLFFLCYRYDNKYTGNAMQPINGILFLGQEELNRYPVHFLVNEWAAYDDILLTPEAFHAAQPPLPDRYMQIGTGPDTVRTGRTSYFLLLELPPVPAAYTMELPEIYSSYSLYVNDDCLISQSLPRSGSYGDSLQTGSITFTAAGDTRILIAAENTSYYYGGILSPPAFGKPQAVSSLLNRQLVFHTVLLTIAGFLALFFFLPGVYSLQPLRYLFTGLCLMYIGYTFHNIQGIFPHPLFLSASVELFCYYGMFLFILLLAGRLCPLDFPFRKALYMLGGSVCLFSPLIPWLGRYACRISEFLNLYKLVIVLVFLLYAFTAALRDGSMRHKSLLAGISIFSAALTADLIWPLFEPIYLGWFPETAGACFIIILGAILLLESQDLKRQQLLLERQQTLYQQHIVRQEQHYEALVDQIERTKKVRHDLRHHVTVLSQMLLDNQVNDALDYLKQYEGTLNLSEKMIFSNYYKIDVIIRHFYTLARENGIEITVSVPLPEQLYIAETNLCIIFGNLLENALESCLRSSGGNSYIRLNTMLNHSWIVISMENTMSGRPVPYKEGFMSTKKTGRKGIGLSSIHSIAQQYGGDTRFEILNDTTFFSQVLLINRENGQAPVSF